MNGLFAASDLKGPDIDLLQSPFLNRPIFGMVLMEGRLCFSYFPEFGLRNKLVKGGIGYWCFFEESFLSGLLRERILELPMFAPGNSVGYLLSERDREKAVLLFLKMIDEQDSTYQYKFDLIRTYLTQLFHLVMRMG